VTPIREYKMVENSLVTLTCETISSNYPEN